MNKNPLIDELTHYQQHEDNAKKFFELSNVPPAEFDKLPEAPVTEVSAEVEQEAELQQPDFMWEITVCPSKCEPAFDSKEEDAKQIGLCLDEGSNIHLLAFAMSIASGILFRNVTKVEFFEETKGLNIHHTAITGVQRGMLTNVFGAQKGIDDFFVASLEDKNFCFALREVDGDRIALYKFSGLTFETCESELDHERAEPMVSRTLQFKYDTLTVQHSPVGTDMLSFRAPYVVLNKGDGFKEFDSQQFAWMMSNEPETVHRDIVRNFNKTVAAPLQQKQRHVKVSRAARKSKRKMQKQSRKAGRK